MSVGPGGIDSELNQQLQKTLTQCGRRSLGSHDTLQTLFTDNRIALWRYSLPASDTLQGRVLTLIDYLYDKYDTKGQNGLVLFLRVLQDQIPKGDRCGGELQELADRLEKSLPDRPYPQPPSRFWLVEIEEIDDNGNSQTTVPPSPKQAPVLPELNDGIVAYLAREMGIAGIGQVVTFETGYGKNVIWSKIDTRLSPPLAMQPLQAALPELAHAIEQRVAIRRITPFEWSVLRELISSQNPTLADSLPPSTEPVQSRIEIREVVPPADPISSGQTFSLTIPLRNQGNLTWHRGISFFLAATWAKETAASLQETQTVSEPILPGGLWDWVTQPLIAPDVSLLDPSPVLNLQLRSENEQIQSASYELTVDVQPTVQTARPKAPPTSKVPVMGIQVVEAIVLGEVRAGTPFSLTVVCSNNGQQDWPADSRFNLEISWLTAPIPPKIHFLDLVGEDLPVGDSYPWTFQLEAPPSVDDEHRLQLTATFAPRAGILPVKPEPYTITIPVLPQTTVEPPLSTSTSTPASLPAVPSDTPIIIQTQPRVRDSNNKEAVILVEIAKGVATLEYDRQKFRSPVKLDEEALKFRKKLTAKQYGQKLFEGIIHTSKIDPNLDSTFEGYTIARQQSDKNLRIQLSVSVTDPLYPYEWEFLWDKSQQEPMAIQEAAPFYRLQGFETGIPTIQAKPIRILFVLCNPLNLKELDPPLNKLQPLKPEEERAVIEKALQPLVAQGLVKYTLLDSSQEGSCTLKEIQEQIEDGVHILHIIAHGVKLNGDFFLVMEDKDRLYDPRPVEDVRQAIAIGHKLRLVMLATCVSAEADKVPADLPAGEMFQSLASELVGADKRVPAVIAMQRNLPISAARLFTEQFYRDLIRTGEVDKAMAATRRALFIGEADSVWGIPVLILGQQDGKLFDVPSEAKQLPPLDLDEWLKKNPPTHSTSPSAPLDVNELVQRALQGLLSQQMASTQSKPLIKPQNPEALSQQLAVTVVLDGDSLKNYILEHSGIVLPNESYGQIAAALSAGKHIILIGPPGTGKTSLAQDICDYAQTQKYSTGKRLTTATADWTTFDTIGGYVPASDQTLQFRAGIFLETIRNAEWLIIDEINRAEIDKAFGELFTVLSGQGVNLPYFIGEEQLSILPALKPKGKPSESSWFDGARKSYDYTIHPNWRIIGTMNIYDKSSLFSMSLAFMRRFAFIDTDLPHPADYAKLVTNWLEKANRADAQLLFDKLLERRSALMECRAIGPAIVKDMIAYMGKRAGTFQTAFAEALLLYIAPQLDSLPFEKIKPIHDYLRDDLLKEILEQSQILERIRSLYPHVSF